MSKFQSRIFSGLQYFPYIVYVWKAKRDKNIVQSEKLQKIHIFIVINEGCIQQRNIYS